MMPKVSTPDDPPGSIGDSESDNELSGVINHVDDRTGVDRSLPQVGDGALGTTPTVTDDAGASVSDDEARVSHMEINDAMRLYCLKSTICYSS